MAYKLICYIRVEPEEEIVYETLEEAKMEKEHCEFLQPENIYKIELVQGGESK